MMPAWVVALQSFAEYQNVHDIDDSIEIPDISSRHRCPDWL